MEKDELQKKVIAAAAENGMNAILFRNTVGRKIGLNITDSQCMSILGILGVSTPKELTRYTGLTTGSTTIMLDRLEAIGYIKRKPNPADRRGVLIEVNQKEWQKNAGAMVADLQKALWNMLSSYTKDELVTILDFITRFSESVKNESERLEKEA
jgi:DNA-binding MarR family transcriptional regulator